MASVGDRTEHPLQNSLILERIFGNLALSDLKECRLVCRAWHQSSGIAVRQLASVRIRNDGQGKGISDYLDLIQSETSTFDESPFTNNYKIYYSLGERGQEFWDFYGNTIKSLLLYRVYFGLEDDFRHVIFRACPNLLEMKLARLVLARVDGAEDGDPNAEPTEWVPPRFQQNRNVKFLYISHIETEGVSMMEILSHFPCLEDLNVQSVNGGCERFFHSLAIARIHDDQSWKIKKLTFNYADLENPDAYVPLIGDLPLETLVIRRVDDVEDVEDVTALINILKCLANSTSFVSLSLMASYYQGSWVMTVLTALNTGGIIFEKLEYLQLTMVNLRSTHFLNSFPNLKKLVLIAVRPLVAFRHEQETLGGDWTLDQCQDLKIFASQVTPDDMRVLLRRLPNLRKLEIYDCSIEVFEVICELLEQLTYLEVSISLGVDCGISGLDEEDVERINEGGDTRNWRPITVARANLGCLKELKWFSWKTYLGTREGIGYCAARFGVQQLPQLQHLRVSGPSHDIWDGLCDQFPWRDQ